MQNKQKSGSRLRQNASNGSWCSRFHRRTPSAGKTQKTIILKLKLPTEERVSDLLQTYFIIRISSSLFPCEISARGKTPGKSFREIWAQYERNGICPLRGFMWLLQLSQKTLDGMGDECWAPPPTMLEKRILNISFIISREIFFLKTAWTSFPLFPVIKQTGWKQPPTRKKKTFKRCLEVNPGVKNNVLNFKMKTNCTSVWNYVHVLVLSAPLTKCCSWQDV